MSWWVSLKKLNQNVEVVDFRQDPYDFNPNKRTKADLDLHFNFDPILREYLDKKQGLSWFKGKKGKDVIKHLEEVVKKLSVQHDPILQKEGIPVKREDDRDKWDNATNGNVKYYLDILLEWAREYPEAVFNVF